MTAPETRNGFDFFRNTDCPYFPCHASEDAENFNCLFCFCPLYRLEDCGGSFTILENGVKDCSGCLFPHRRENYEKIIKALRK